MFKKAIYAIIKCLALSVLVLVMFADCSRKTIRSGTEKCIANCEEPAWAYKPKDKDTDKTKAFVGQSFKHATERMAIQYAETNAREKVLNDLWGAYGKQKMRQVLSNAGAATEDIISDAVVSDVQSEWKSAGAVKGNIDEYHVQRWEKYDETGSVSYFYTAKVLYSVNRDLMKEFLTELLANQKAQAKTEQDQKNIERALELMKNMQNKEFAEW